MKAWYEESFGTDYLLVYKHRDKAGASDEVRTMIGWLGLPDGASVLDLCCGMGRHALALADAGCRVTGIDLSGALLHEAERLDVARRVKWRQGDMRHLPYQAETFDAVVNLFTSFGYFQDDEQNLLVLKELHRVLKRGGRFIIDFLNPGDVRARLVPHSVRIEEGKRIEETRTIEDRYVRKRIVVSEEGREDRRYIEQVKLYELSEFRRFLQEAGLVLEDVRGGYDGLPYCPDSSRRLILIGSKPKSNRDRGTE